MSAPDRTHYDVLGIARDADATAIRAAWKLHVQVWHPDRFSGEMRDKAEQEAARINEAYTTLRDSSRRAAYDCRLAAEDETAAAAANPAPSASSTARSNASSRASAHAIHHRGPATPIGTPLNIPAPAPTLSSQLAEGARDLWALVRQHPRTAIAACSALVVVFGGTLVMSAVTGPSLPSGTTVAAHAQVVAGPSSADDEQVEDLEQLAERARVEAARADAELQQLLREDALAAEQAARAAAAAAAQAERSADPRAGAGAAPKLPAPKRARPDADEPAVAPPGGRIVRIMPRTK